MFSNYLKIAWRSVWNSKLYSSINIVGLALGLSVCMLITLYIKDEYSFDQFQKNKDKIFRLVADERSPEGKLNTIGLSGYIQGTTFAIQIPEIEKIVRLTNETINIKHKNEVFTENANAVDSTFFSMFDAEFVEGNPIHSLVDPRSIVISEDKAKKYFGNHSALNQTLSIEQEGGFENFTIVGVLKKSPINSSIQNEILLPMHFRKNDDNAWINFYMNTFFILKDGSNLANVEKKMDAIYQAEAKNQIKEAAEKWGYKSTLNWKLQPFLDMHLSRAYTAQNGLKESGNPIFSYFLSGIAIFVLIIACINFINISISRSISRSKEIGLRKVVGGQKNQLMFQFIFESFLLTLAAFILSICITFWVLPTFNDLSHKALSFGYLFDTKLFLVFAGLLVITSLLAGFYPALVLSSYNPVDTLYGRFILKNKNFLSKSLTVLQFGLATFFILLSILQYRQTSYFVHQDLGYDDKNILVLPTYNTPAHQIETLINRIKDNASVQKVAPSNQGNWYTMSALKNGDIIDHSMTVVDHRYADLLGLEIVVGRNFSTQFPSDSVSSVIVNEAFAKAANWKDPIGQIIKFNNDNEYTVVGVVKNYHSQSLYDKINPQLLMADMKKGGYGVINIKISDENKPQTIAAIKKVYKELMPTKPFEYTFLSDDNDRHYDKEVMMKKIIFTAACLCIFISCIGLFGLAALTTQRRFKEIGVRKVFGASIYQVIVSLTYKFLILILIAYVIFAPIAYMVGEMTLQNYPNRITQGFSMFALTILGLLILGFITVSLQVVRAATMNPVHSLKSE